MQPQLLSRARLLFASSLLLCALFTTACGWRLTNELQVPLKVVFLEKGDPIRLAQDVPGVGAYYFNAQGVETYSVFTLPAGAWVVFSIDGIGPDGELTAEAVGGTNPKKEGE